MASGDQQFIFHEVKPQVGQADVEAVHAQGSAASVTGIARGSVIGFAGTIVSQGSLMATVALVAARLGSTGLGIFSEAYAVLTLATLAATLGMQTSLTRYVAGYVAAGDWPDVRPIVRLGTAVSTGASLVLAGAVAALSPWLANDVLGEPRVATPLVLVAISLPFAVYARTAGAVLQGHQRMRDFVVVTLIVEPVVRLVGIAAAFLAGGGIDAAAGVLVVSNVASAVWAAHRLRVSMLPVARRGAVQWRPFLRFSSITWVATMATTGLVWADTLLLGIYRSSDDVGVYQVATRLVALATIGSVPIASAFAPRITTMIQRRDWGALSDAYSATTTWSTRLAVPALAICLVAPGDLLRLFGRHYQAAAAVTVILVVGKLVEAATGPCGMVLNMSSQVGLNAANNVAALALNVVLNVILIPRLGLDGAAIAWSVSLVLVNLCRLLEVKATIGLRLFEPGAAKAIAAVVPAALLAWLLVAPVDNWAVRATLSTLVVLIGYAVVVRKLTWTSTDEVTASALWESVGARVRRPPAVSGGVPVPSGRSVAPGPVRLASRGEALPPAAPGESTPLRISIAELISPLRLDVLIRAEFFRFAEAHLDLWERDRRAFMQLAYGQDYRVWYRDIASQLSAVPLRSTVQRHGYERRVARSVAMMQRFATQGFDDRRPINLWHVADVRPTFSGKNVSRSFFIGDGCHRLALLHNSGVEALTEDMVRCQPVAAFAPRDNTYELIRRIPMSEGRLLQFLASGYGVAAEPGESLESVLQRMPADRAAEFAAVAAIDLPAVGRSERC